MPRIVLMMIALAVFATVGVAGFQAGLENAGEDQLVVNETWTPDAGNVTTLDESNRDGAYYSENVTVFDENETEMEAGTDYRWFGANGTIKALAGGSLDGDSEATVSYSYQQTTETQRSMATILAAIPQLAGLALPIGALFVLLLFIKGV
jgi:hypothetical protein